MADAIRVLHVDDEPDFAELTAAQLEQLASDFSVETATGAGAGLERLREDRFDCIVSDYRMPELDGLQFLEAVRDENPGIPFILFTGEGSETVASEAIHAGVSEYLQKGRGTERFELLANRIRNVVERRRAETSYQEIFEKATDGIVLHRPTGEIIDANRRMAELSGYSREDLIDMTVADFSVDEPDYSQDEAERLVRLAAEEGPQVFEWHLDTPDRGRVPVEVHLKNTTIEGKECVLAMVRDISDARQQKERFERYVDVVENMEEGTYILDEANTFDFVNERVAKESGIPVEDWVGQPLSILADLGIATPEGVDAIEKAAEAIRRGDADERRVQLTVDLPAPIETLELRLTGLESDRVLGTTRNITEFTHRERALKALHGVATEIGSFDSEEEVCQRTITAAKDVLDFDLSVVNLERDGMLPVIAISSELPQGGATTMSVDEGLAGKTYRTGESILMEDIDEHPEANPQGPYRSGISVAIDGIGVFQAVAEDPGEFDETDIELAELLVSHTATAIERIRRERELERQNQRLEEFASVVSHDLRNPLNVANGHLELLEAECESDRIDIIANAHDRMDGMIQDLLMLARQGEIVGELERVRFDSFVPECWQNVSTDEAELTIAEDVAIMADPEQLKSLLENLFRNAVEHGGDAVTVRVGGFDDGFFVEDDGLGIPEADRDRIFDIGYSSADSGSGFGLGIVRRIAEAHEWSIEVTESQEGGARFEFTGVSHPAD